MRGLLKYPAFVAFFVYCSVCCGAVSFSRFPSNLGFPQTNISGIAQDAEGDIWITSADGGAYRYNGSGIEKIDGENKFTGVLVDSSGRVFLGTSSKIFLYDDILGMTVFSSRYGFREAEVTPEGDVFFLSSKNLVVLRSGCDSLETVFGTAQSNFLSIEYQAGSVYFGDSAANLFKVATKSLSVEKAASFADNIISLTCQGDSLLWVSHYGKGVSCYDIASEKVVKTIDKADGLSSGIIQCMCFENDSTLWLGSYEGLNMLNINDYSVSVSRSYYFDDKSLPHDSVKVLFKDSQGGMWIGTYFGGVCYYHKSRNRFQIFSQGFGPDYLNDSVVSCICEGPDGTLWIGTNNGGINEYDRTTGRFKYYRFNNADSKRGNPSNDVKAFLCLPGNRYVCVGLFRGGLNLLDRKTGGIRRLNSPRNVVSIEQLDADRLVLSSYNDTYIYTISKDEYSVCENRKMSVSRFTKSELLPGVKVASVLEGPVNDSWYATDNGLYKYDNSDSTYVHYSTSDGLACDYYNPGAACLTGDGTMYFGGVGGVTYFNPSNFRDEESCPKPLLRSIVVNEDEILDLTLPIRLKSNQNHLSFNYSVPDYISVSSNEFEYMLEGFDKDWTSSGGKASAFYPNLPPGVYRFKLRASRGNAEWEECEFQPRIKIFRPWYSSIGGVFAELLIVVFSAVFFARSYSKRKEMEHALALSKMEEKYQRDISKLKALKLVNAQLRIDQKSQPVIEDISRQNELFITKAMSIVEANISNEEFSTEMLAQKMAMSRASLHIRIKEATGHSALEFIQKIRFSEACRLLEEGELPVSEIGYRIGISSPSYFSASFKKIVGCTPKEYASKQNLKQ